MKTKTITRSKVVSQNVGGIIDYGDESFVILPPSNWTMKKSNEAFNYTHKKLEKLTQKTLKIIDENIEIKVERFPKWHWCSSCKSLKYINPYHEEKTISENGPICRKCKRVMTPMRFVAVCDNGHMAEIDYKAFVHQDRSIQCEGSELYYKTSGKHGGDWDQMIVGCKTCKQKHSFKELVNGPLNKWFIQMWNNPEYKNSQCSGNQPWMNSFRENCDKRMYFEQKGSSTIYRPKVLSALKIEETLESKGEADSDIAENLLSSIRYIRSDHAIQTRIKRLENTETVDALIVEKYPELENKDQSQRLEKIKKIMIDKIKNKDKSEDINTPIEDKILHYEEGQKNILSDEFKIFSQIDNYSSDDFTVEFSNFDNKDIFSSYFSKIGMVRNLTEVRCFAGFTRKEGDKFIDADMGRAQKPWLPVVEAKGEGIFIGFNTKKYKEWKEINKENLDNYMDTIYNKYSGSIISKIFKIELSPLFILMHTFSHLIIRELVFEAGYPSSSLKERIYFDGDEGGILVYTTEVDNAGTLGGLVEQGRVNRIKKIITNSIKRANWCSADPVCSELEFQGWNNLNTSACHACSLLPETSCSYGNVFLNRSFLIGKENISAFFKLQDFI